MARSTKRPSDRLDGKYKLDTTGCWVWIASKDRDGYGMFWDGAATVRAMRFLYEMEYGSIPHGSVLDHLCRNVSCVNPAHLDCVSVAINTQRGKSAKLDWKKVGFIRDSYQKKELKQVDLANKFGVGQDVISRIVNNKTWYVCSS